MKKIYLLLLMICLVVVTRGQTTVRIFAGGYLPDADSITGSANNFSGQRVKDSIFSDAVERGYGVFDLSTIPGGVTITSVKIAFHIATYNIIAGAPSAWNIYGYAGDLSLVTSEATLFTDCTAGTSLWTNNWGTTAPSSQLFASVPAAVTFVGAHIGSKVSMCFTSGGYVRYGITGEAGDTTSGGVHAPYIDVTYTSPCGSIVGTNTVCPGATTTLTDSTTGGTWSSSNTSIATVSSGGVVTGVAGGFAVISYVVGGTGGCVAIDTVTVTSLAAIAPSSGVSVCVGGNATLTETTGGGAWSSSNLSVATVSSAGTICSVTGVSTGTATISYTVGSCTVTKIITVNTSPAPISPSSASVCVGGTATFADAVFGGVWTISGGGASVSGGVVTGLSVGTDTVTYAISGCSTTAIVNVTSGTAAISPAGPINLCTGTTVSFTDATTGGTWSSSNTTVATVGATTGIVNASSAGVATIRYTVGSCIATETITVSTSPAAISPTSATVCSGNNITLSDATAGGAWSSSSGSAIVAGGVVTGVGAGVAIISYTLGSCSATSTVTVITSPAAIAPSGPISICTGTSTTLSDATGGGVWTTTNPLIATVSGGVVTGAGTGTTNVTYSISGCYVTQSVTVTSGPTLISPTSASMCTGTSGTFTDGVGGGAWVTGNPAVATVAGGVVTPVGTGTTLISYVLGTCITTSSITVNSGPVAISPSGLITVCAGSTTTLTDATSGGVWTSGNPAVATVSAGVVTGISGGSATISYSIGSCTVMKVVTVIGSISPISPSSGSICAGATLNMTDATSGGTWASSASGIASVAGGVVTGVSTGTAIISYTVGSCTTTASVTVNNLPTAVTPSTATICQGNTVTLTDATAGGSWNSSSMAVASVSAGGVVTGTAAGVATISYSVGTCSSTATITVISSPTAISPSSATVCAGSSLSLIESVGGGTWSSSAPGVATVSSSGLVSGVSAGTTTITYSIGGSCNTTATITVNPLAIAGTVLGAGSICGVGSITLTDATPGGVWSASNGNATVTAGGVVTGVATGTDVISYSVTNSCGTVAATATVTVDGVANAGSISGPAVICAGSFTLLADSIAGGTWSLSNGLASITGTGLMTGLAIGTDTVSYTVSNACGSVSATKIMNILPLPAPGPISGATSVCTSSSITLTDGVAGGTWGRSNTHATVSGSGVVTGASAGIDTISYSMTNSCGTVASTFAVTVFAFPTAGTITGSSTVCQGSLITLVDLATGGSFSSSNSNATVIPATGVVTGVLPGVDTITYTVTNLCGTASTTKAITVNPLPAPAIITGPGSVCVGTAITLADASAGGVWNASNSSAAISGTGIVTGIIGGIDTISYTLTNSCGSSSSTALVIVNAGPFAGTITGTADVCVGSFVTLSDIVAGGTWSITNSNAVISGTGVVFGVTAGLDTAKYSVTNMCGTATATLPMTVNAFPSAGVISGANNVCTGASISLTETIAGGTWSTGDASIATVSATGVVSGVAVGTDTISYTIINVCGTVGTFKIIAVDTPANPGSISGPSEICLGSVIALSDPVSGGIWSSGSTNATVTGTGSVTGVTAGVAPISYSVTNLCGTVSATFNVSVVTFPTSGTISGPNAVCVGSAITLLDPISGGTWLLSNGSASLLSPGILSGIATGIDSVFYSVTNACGTAVSTYIVTVNPTPVVSAITGSANMCVGNSITLSDATAGGAWTNDNMTVASINSLDGVLTGLTAGITNVTYSLTNAFGCTGSSVVTDTVFAIPVPTSITGITSLCAGSTTTLSNATPFGTWSSSNVTIALVDAATGVVTSLSSGSVLIFYSVNNICGTATDSTMLTVNAVPVVAAISGPSASICAGGTTLLTDATSGGTWSSSDLTVATIGSATGLVTSLTAGSATFTYSITNSAGCSGDATITLSFGSSIGTSYILPATASICNGHNAYMHIVTSGSGLTYQWYRNGVLIPGATNYNYSADSTGSYSAVVSNGVCEETLSGTSVSVTVRPVIAYTAPNVLYVGSYATYQWYRNYIAIPGATNAVFTFTLPGTYIVIASDASGCTDTSGTYVITGGGGSGGGGGTGSSSVANVNISEVIKLYPNPAMEIVHIASPVSVNVRISSPDGKVVLEQKDAVDVNVSNLASGMYIVLIYDENDILIKTDKIMKL